MRLDMHPSRRAPILAVFAGLVVAFLATGCGGPSTPAGAGPVDLEDPWLYPMSQIFLQRDDEQPMRALDKANEVLGQIRSGRSFSDVAEEYTDDASSKPLGGFLGFIRPRGDERFYGAIEALPPGIPSYPVDTPHGVYFFLRHTFDEGREKEAQVTLAAYGFFVAWHDVDTTTPRTKAEAFEAAREAIRAVEAGEKTLGEAGFDIAAERPTRRDAFLGRIRSTPPTEELYDKLHGVAPGTFHEPFETPRGVAVLRKKPLFRSIARHILVRHVDSPDRPLSLRRSHEDAKKLAEQVLQEAAPDGSNWADLVRRFSDDTLTVPLQGSLGTIGNGDAFPEMEDILAKTPPGHVAQEIAEDAQGFHVLYRVR